MLNSIVNNIAFFYKLDGRTSRLDFWIYLLFLLLLSYAIRLLIGDVFSSVFTTFMAIPVVALAVRRMHDIGKPGWFVAFPAIAFLFSPLLKIVTGNHMGHKILSDSQLLEQAFNFLTIIGFVFAVYTLILAVFPSEAGSNKYGANPDPNKALEPAKPKKKQILAERIELPEMRYS